MLIDGGFLGWFNTHRAQLRLAVRVTIAAVLAFTIANLLDLPQGYWAVFTAIVVMQTSVGGSVKTGLDWLIGTIGGAIVGIVVATLMPSHDDALTKGVAMAIVVAPLALLAAVRPSFRVAPLTAVIVVLGLNPAYSALQSAFDRVLEIAIGSTIGVVVSLTVLPARAHGLVAEAAADGLEVCAALVTVLLEAVAAGVRPTPTDALHAALRRALTRLETVTEEAERERTTRLSTEPDTGPLARTLRRLRSDLAMITRAADLPLPAAVVGRMGSAILHVARATVAFLGESAASLRARTPAPQLSGLSIAIAEYNAVFAVLRRDGAAHTLSDDVTGRIFALGFALEQLQDNCEDLANRTTEQARARK